MQQYITHATHDSGHTIDLVITDASSTYVICPLLLDTNISDRKTVCIDLHLIKPTVHKKLSCRQLRRIDLYEFNKGIAPTFSNVKHLDFDSFVQFFNTTLTFIPDKHALLKTVSVTP